MREIQSEIIINAPATKVWKVLMDFENWEKWNPIVKNAKGKASLGEKLSISMIGKGDNDGPKYDPTITIYEEAKLFRWRAKMMAEFLMTNDKVFELYENGSQTRLIHKELFSGMFVPLFWSKFKTGVPLMLDSMNEALKKNIENE
jgi:hypothetical protein